MSIRSKKKSILSEFPTKVISCHDVIWNICFLVLHRRKILSPWCRLSTMQQRFNIKCVINECLCYPPLRKTSLIPQQLGNFCLVLFVVNVWFGRTNLGLIQQIRFISIKDTDGLMLYHQDISHRIANYASICNKFSIYFTIMTILIIMIIMVMMVMMTMMLLMMKVMATMIMMIMVIKNTPTHTNK